MRKYLLATVLSFGVLGFSAPNEAKASWLSEAFGHSQIQLNIGTQYPAYSPPVCAPFPVYPVYQPAPVYVQTPVYAPAPVYPVYRPAPVYVQRPVYVPAPHYAPVPTAPYGAYRPAYGHVPHHASWGTERYEPYRHDWNQSDWRR